MITFRNLTFFFILLGLLSVTNAIAVDGSADNLHGTKVHVPVRINYQNLKAIGERYVAFLQKVGQSDTPVTKEEVSQLFAPQCTKIVNGNVLFTSSSALPDQLSTARSAVGKWSIKTLLTTVSPDDGTCTIQIKGEGEKMGKLTTMMVIFLDDREKISQIHEVYSEYKKTKLSNEDN